MMKKHSTHVCDELDQKMQEVESFVAMWRNIMTKKAGQLRPVRSALDRSTDGDKLSLITYAGC